MIKLAAGWSLAIALALATVSTASGQEADIQIVKLKCKGDPEIVLIKNVGDAAQPLAGWQLESDPASSETFDLGNLGSLLPGASVSIQSGPSASGVFNWGLDYIFRDGDPTDYVSLVDDTGSVVQQVKCAEEAAAKPSPTPSPEPSPADNVPNGGGAPPVAGGAPLAAMMVLIGGCVAAAGVATSALSWMRFRYSPAVGTMTRSHAQPGGSDACRGEPTSAAVRLALVGLFAVALAFRLLRRHPQ
jgi:MYXO-CTERM domain-containing protein